jgi:hypothetical protein
VSVAANQAPQEDYADAAERCFADGDRLYQGQRYANACHLFGLGAECALKVLLAGYPGLVSVPHKHLPELRDDVLRTLSGRRHNGVRQLLNTADYMVGWEIGNRYWPTEAFTGETSTLHRDHCRRTLYATGVRSGI